MAGNAIAPFPPPKFPRSPVVTILITSLYFDHDWDVIVYECAVSLWFFICEEGCYFDSKGSSVLAVIILCPQRTQVNCKISCYTWSMSLAPGNLACLCDGLWVNRYIRRVDLVTWIHGVTNGVYCARTNNSLQWLLIKWSLLVDDQYGMSGGK